MDFEWNEYWDRLDRFIKANGIKHFNAREVSKCSRAGDVVNEPAPERLWANIIPTLKLAEEIRAAFGGKPVHVASGYRSAKYNKAIGGVPRSQHMQFRALDIVVTGAKPSAVFDWMEKNYPKQGGKYGRGRYKSFTHIDTRKNYSVWDLS